MNFYFFLKISETVVRKMGSTEVALWCKNTFILLCTGFNCKTVQTGDHACTHTQTHTHTHTLSHTTGILYRQFEVTTPDTEVVSLSKQ